MRSSLWLSLACGLLLMPLGCTSNNNNNQTKKQCSDGLDNDGDGKIDFPDDPGCTAADDDSEDSSALAQCSDGRDNDMDGKTDYPTDPGCFAAQQDDETDDCPSGAGCPQCSDGIDNDGNGQMDYPNDPGCAAASDTDEYTENPVACGANVMIKQLPFDKHVSGMLMPGSSNLASPMCTGIGPEDVYELRINAPKVVVADTASGLNSTDTVLSIRSSMCAMDTSELICNDDVSTTVKGSSITVSLQPGTYYLVVDSKSANPVGTYDLNVHYYVGEGTTCIGGDECGPGLVCRIPLGGTGKVCSKHVCEDGVDDDGDGKNDFPQDPGCISPKDDDEADNCPSGVGCPECGNGIDDDGDAKIDFPLDTQCLAASSASEACVSHETVAPLTMPVTMGTTIGSVNDTKPLCGSSTSMAPDNTYRVDLPAVTNLKFNVTGFDTATALYNSTCTGTAVACSDPPLMTIPTLAAGTYYFVVDGYSTTAQGAYTITVSGNINNNASCESALAQSGALTCNTGYTCKGTVGARTCQPSMCLDGIDNDGDNKIDYPFDPGCSSPADDTEADPATPPVCGNGLDEDGDTLIDFPADFGCSAASDTSEAFCPLETDVPAVAITTRDVMGTTIGKANDFLPTCQTGSNGPDVTFALQLPVPVVTLQLDTNNSTFDSEISVRDAHCGVQLGCDDDSGTPGLESQLILSNVPAGNYAVTVDSYSTAKAFTMHVFGTVAAGTSCASPLFAGGAQAVLLCPAPTTCTGTPKKCQ